MKKAPPNQGAKMPAKKGSAQKGPAKKAAKKGKK
jgi:hypothetical protein